MSPRLNCNAQKDLVESILHGKIPYSSYLFLKVYYIHRTPTGMRTRRGKYDQDILHGITHSLYIHPVIN